MDENVSSFQPRRVSTSYSPSTLVTLPTPLPSYCTVTYISGSLVTESVTTPLIWADTCKDTKDRAISVKIIENFFISCT